MSTDTITQSIDEHVLSLSPTLPQSTNLAADNDQFVSVRSRISRDTDVEISTQETTSYRVAREYPQQEPEPVSEVSGSIVEFNEFGVFCELYICGDSKYVNVQRDLFPQVARVGMPIVIRMEKGEGLTRFVVRERIPDANALRQGVDEIDNLVSSL